MTRLAFWRIGTLCLCSIVAMVGGTACGLLTAEVNVQGTVHDASGGQPITGAIIAVVTDGTTKNQTRTSSDGTFRLIGVKPDSSLLVQADGYRQSVVEKPQEKMRVDLEPIVVNVAVSDAVSGQAIDPVSLTCDSGDVREKRAGLFEVSRIKPGSLVVASAEGYASAEITFTEAMTLSLALRPNTLSGKVGDASNGQPIVGARVQAGDIEATSGADGSYLLSDLPSGSLQVRITAAGYDAEIGDIPEGQTHMDFALDPFVVRAPYVTFYAAGAPDLFDPVLNLVDSTELNSVVVDIKGDRGWIAYRSDVPLAETIGANEVNTISDIDGFMADLKKRGIYSIARIVVFKDDPLARNGSLAGLDVAVRDSATGGLWVDGENLGWVDPFRQEVWDYNLALAKEAAEKGFDEIQFDYIRFPTDPSAGTSVDRTVFSQPNTEANRLEAVANFLFRAAEELKPLGVNISVDVFGYTCWRDDDMGIGQKLEVIGQYADFICPMVYPSTYSHGIPDYTDAVGHPYEIVYHSVKNAVDRLRGMTVKVRPWLQYFDDYPWASGRPYNEAEIEAQKEAVVEAGGCGWQLWDPFVKYARGGIAYE